MSIQTVKIPFVGDNGETLFANFANPDAETTAIQVLGSASISAAQSKFYGDQSDGSLALSGTNGNGVFIPTHKGLEQISGSFHISAYVYLSSLTISELFAFGDTAHVTLNAAGDVEFSSTTGNWTAITGAGLASINTWHHVAVTVTGTTAYLFFDGTLVGSANITATQAQNKGFYIGANLHSQSPINGYVQDFLIETQGTLPIAAFTVPDAQAGILSGKVKNELAVELPNKKVCIHRQSDGMLLSRTDSDANGDFSAWGILPAENHYIVGIGAPTETPDILSHKESVILTPTPTPTPTPVLLDTSNKGAIVVLSNNDLTATVSLQNYSAVTSDSSHLSSDNTVYEMSLDSQFGASHAYIAGVVTTATHTNANVLDGLMFDASGNGFYGFLFAAGHHSINGVRTNNTFTPLIAGDKVQIRVSQVLMEAVVNNIVIDSIAIPTGIYYSIVAANFSILTANFGASAFDNTIPFGFTSRDGSQTG